MSKKNIFLMRGTITSLANPSRIAVSFIIYNTITFRCLSKSSKVEAQLNVNNNRSITTLFPAARWKWHPKHTPDNFSSVTHQTGPYVTVIRTYGEQTEWNSEQRNRTFFCKQMREYFFPMYNAKRAFISINNERSGIKIFFPVELLRNPVLLTCIWWHNL